MRQSHAAAGLLLMTLLSCAPRSGGFDAQPKQPSDTSPAAPDSPAAQAVRLYDEGRYDEARPLLESLDAEGKLDGPLLYRLGFCVGPGARQSELMQRALTQLETSAATADTLEVSFFLANALANVGRGSDARTVAASATGRIEKREWPAASAPIDHFRVGKLYQDQGRAADAAASYRTALEGWQRAGAKVPGYEKWARRFLAQDAFTRGEYRQAQADYGALTALGGATPADFDRLAVARVKAGELGGAAEAWREAERLDPANADRPRYCRHLARLAESCPSLPASAPSGAAWPAVTPTELESLMAEQAKLLRDARVEVEGGPSVERKAELTRNVANAKAVFAAAGLEYASRYLDIRQTAFTGGYAPLIFHPDQWSLEPPSEGP